LRGGTRGVLEGKKAGVQTSFKRFSIDSVYNHSQKGCGGVIIGSGRRKKNDRGEGRGMQEGRTERGWAGRRRLLSESSTTVG